MKDMYISQEAIQTGDLVKIGDDRGRWRGIFKTNDPSIAFGVACNSVPDAERGVEVETPLSQKECIELCHLQDQLDNIRRADFLTSSEKKAKTAQVMDKIRAVIKKGANA